MNSSWHISENYKGTVMAKAFSGLEHTFSIQGEEVSRGTMGRVTKVKINDRFYFVKKYTLGGRRLRKYVGKSRVRGDWENLMYFSRLGIPTAKIVAYGQELKWGLFQRGALITEGLEDTTDLAAMARNGSPLLKDRLWIKQVGRQIADCTKRMHDSRFVHNDLRWRNILVTCGEKPQVFFIDCPMGRKRFGPVLRRWIIKDLASLDKDAKHYLSRTVRLWFYKVYRGRKKLTTADKRSIKKIVSFYSGRE